MEGRPEQPSIHSSLISVSGSHHSSSIAFSLFMLVYIIKEMEGRLEQQQQKLPIGDRWKDIQDEHSWEGLLDPFDPTLKSEILRYGDFVCACYTATENDRILSEKSLFAESKNLRECGYEIKNYIYANVRSSRPGFARKKRWSKIVWIGFIAVCIDETEIRRLGRRDIVVAFRGTSGRREWIQNPKGKVAPWPYLPESEPEPDVGVHKGFLGFYKEKGLAKNERSAREIIISNIARLLANYEKQTVSITVTGHSLGGALAIMSAYDIKLLEPSIPVTVFAFASPRVGNRAFANHMEQIGVKVLRVVVKSDLIPMVRGLILNKKTISRKEILRERTFCHVGIKFQLESGLFRILRWRDKHFHGHGLYIHLYSLYIIDGYYGSNQPFLSSERGNNYLPTSTKKHIAVGTYSKYTPCNYFF